MQFLGGIVAVAGHFVAGFVQLAKIGQRDLQALVQERHLLETATQRLEVVCGGLEDRRIGPEGDGCAGGLVVCHGLTLRQRCRGVLVLIGLGPVESLAAHFDVHAGGQRVHHGDTHAVQTAGNGIAATAELAAGVQLGHHGFHAGDTFARHDIDGDATAIVHDANAVIRQNRDFDMAGVTCQRLIHRIIDDLIHQMVQAARTSGSDIHAWADTHGLKTFKNLKIGGVVMFGSH